MAAQTQLSIRVPEEWVARIDRIAEALSRPGTKASRNDAVRFIVAKGLDASESELGIRTSKGKR